MKEVSKIIKEVLDNYTLQGDSTDLSAEVTVIEPEEAGFCYGTGRVLFYIMSRLEEYPSG